MYKIKNVLNFGFVICNLFGAWCFGFVIFLILPHKRKNPHRFLTRVFLIVFSSFEVDYLSGHRNQVPMAILEDEISSYWLEPSPRPPLYLLADREQVAKNHQ
jgi:hypothetical protein